MAVIAERGCPNLLPTTGTRVSVHVADLVLLSSAVAHVTLLTALACVVFYEWQTLQAVQALREAGVPLHTCVRRNL